MKRFELVAGRLSDLLPALDLPEPQTRWMIIQVFGNCAELNPDIAEKAVDHAKHYLAIQQGVCLSGAAARYLGNVGALSSDHARISFPILLEALDKALPNEVDWILEGFLEIYDNLDEESQRKIVRGAAPFSDAPKKSTRQRVKRVIAKAETRI